MNIIVIGSGRVGSRLATMLDAEGHQVSIIDNCEDSFDALPKNFGGFKTIGIPIDQDVLRNANIENCDALAAISPNDNMNIMVSQLAKEIFEVPKVLARICDPKRENVFSHFGLQTICPTNITVAAVNSSLTDSEEAQTVHLGTNTINFICKVVSKDKIGTYVSDFELKPTQQIYAILHADNKLTAYHHQKVRLIKGDKVVITTLVD